MRSGERTAIDLSCASSSLHFLSSLSSFAAAVLEPCAAPSCDIFLDSRVGCLCPASAVGSCCPHFVQLSQFALFHHLSLPDGDQHCLQNHGGAHALLGPRWPDNG
eukprot:6051884-Pyramimonas_sp.AAC.1